MTIREMIEVLQAAERGETIQCRIGEKTVWLDVTHKPLWDFIRCDYRVKPKPLEGWVNVYKTGFISPLYPTHAEARECPPSDHDYLRTVHMREVEE